MNAGDLPVGTRVGIAACWCTFKVTGRDPECPAHVVFEQRDHCGIVYKQVGNRTIACPMAKGQKLWLFDSDPLAGKPGRHDLWVIPAKPLSPGLRRALGRLSRAKNGIDAGPETRSVQAAAWRRSMLELVRLGYASPYVDLGYEITPIGRSVHSWHVLEAEVRAAMALSRYNAANERGRSEAAEKHLNASQRWLDEANDLRGLGEMDP